MPESSVACSDLSSFAFILLDRNCPADVSFA